MAARDVPQAEDEHGEPSGDDAGSDSVAAHRYRQQTGELHGGGIAQQRDADQEAVKKAGEVGSTTDEQRKPPDLIDK